MYPKNVYQIRETVCDKFESFHVTYTDNQKLFNNMAIFDIESICVDDESCRDTKTTTWIGKRIPLSVSISSNLIQETIFLCDPNSRDVVSSFIDALENLATKCKTQLKMIFLQIETAIKSRLAGILETPNQRRVHCVGTEAEDD